MRGEVRIVDGERPFALEELFFSTTDPTGRIRASNAVFERIAGYTTDELRGQPHSIIRHPDMPRVVFRILWDHLQAGKGVAAYVKNRAVDGTYYWVLAAARPVDGGYLSVRMKPTSPLFGAARSIYADLRALEAGVEADGGTRSEAIERSAARLDELLAGAGFASYDTFMRTALVTEVTARHQTLAGRRSAGTGQARLSTVGRAALRLSTHLDDELGSLDGYLALNQRLTERCAGLMALTNRMTLLALNVELAAGRLGRDGEALRAVASLMHDTCPRIVEQSRALVREMSSARDALEGVGFAVALASLQNEMALSFLDEMASGRDDHEAAASVAILAQCLHTDVEAVLAALAAIGDSLHDVARHGHELQGTVGTLGAIERNARVEASRTAHTASFLTLLGDVRDQVADADADTDRIGVLVKQFEVGRRTKGRAEMLDDAAHLVEACGARV